MNEIIVPSPLVGEGEETVFDAHPVGGEVHSVRARALTAQQRPSPTTSQHQEAMGSTFI